MPAWAHARVLASLITLTLLFARIHIFIVTRRLPDLPGVAKHPRSKLRLVFNDRGELLDFVLTLSNVDNHKPVPQLARRLFGKQCGDKGYLSARGTLAHVQCADDYRHSRERHAAAVAGQAAATQAGDRRDDS